MDPVTPVRTRDNRMKTTNRLASVMPAALAGGALFALLLVMPGCGAAEVDDGEVAAASADELSVKSSFTARGSGYYPDSSSMEGGYVDRLGKPLKTLQSFLKGSAAYVSVAMDTSAFKYGTRLRIKELEAKHGKAIIFRVVDTGGAFKGKGRSRIDVCVANRSASLDSTVNGTLHIEVIDESGGSGGSTPDDSSGAGSPSSGGGGSTGGGTSGSGTSGTGTSGSGTSGSGTSGGGAACASDGQCNPGNDGSGLICTAGRCVSGCRKDYHCPGSTTCVSGQCR